MGALRMVGRFVVCAAGLLGCGDNQEPDQASALWTRIHDEGYRSFARAPGWEVRKPTGAPHSTDVDIYVNGVLAAALEAGAPLTEWPVGSMVIKDGFDSSGEFDLVAVLDKRDDGWFFAEYTDVETGSAKFSGRPDVCLGCHTEGNDHINAFGLP